MSTTAPNPAPAFWVVPSDLELVDDPIPADWVLEGSPHARCSTWARSADATTDHWAWECTAGRFRWYFATDETVVVVEGSVTISAEGMAPVRLGVGDAAYFPAGTWTVWDVESYIRKHAVLRTPVAPALARLVRGLGHRAHRLR